MALPLMPSTEPFQPKPEPEPVARSTGWADNIIPGCQCSMCVGAQPVLYGGSITGRQAEPLGTTAVQGFQRGVYDNSNNAGGQAFHGAVRWRIPGTLQVCDETGRSQWTYDEELPDGSLVCTQGSDTGARWVPDVLPQLLVNGRIRGRYDPSTTGGLFFGEQRWLDSTEGWLYDDDGWRCNTVQRQPNGEWWTGGGLRWEAT